MTKGSAPLRRLHADADADQARVGRQERRGGLHVLGQRHEQLDVRFRPPVGFVAFASLQLLHHQVDRADAASAV